MILWPTWCQVDNNRLGEWMPPCQEFIKRQSHNLWLTPEGGDKNTRLREIS